MSEIAIEPTRTDPCATEPHSDHGPSPGALALGVAALAGGAALLSVAMRRDRWRPAPHSERVEAAPVTVRTHLTVRASRDEIYRFWRHPERVPEVLRHVKSVEELDDTRSRWVATGPGGVIEWEAEIEDDRPGELLSWRSVEGSPIRQAGRLELSDAAPGRGVEVTLEMGLAPPGGRLTAPVAGLLEPAVARTIQEDMRRFKNLLEAGEVPTNRPQPHGDRAAVTLRNPF